MPVARGSIQRLGSIHWYSDCEAIKQQVTEWNLISIEPCTAGFEDAVSASLVGLTCVIVRTAERRLAMCCVARWSCKMCGWERWKNCSVRWTARAPAVHKQTFYNVLYKFPFLPSVHIYLPLFITSLSSTLNTHFHFPFPSYIHHLNKYLISCTSQNKIGCLLSGYGKYRAFHWQSEVLYVSFRS